MAYERVEAKGKETGWKLKQKILKIHLKDIAKGFNSTLRGKTKDFRARIMSVCLRTCSQKFKPELEFLVDMQF